MITISELIEKMIDHSEGNIHDIDHFIRVWTYARTIGKSEKLEYRDQFILEASAIMHDIACPLCRKKYGCADGRHQEYEGGILAAEFLAGTDIPDEWTDRIVYLVSHHHTFTDIDGIDYQILLEADYIANATENGYSADNARKFSDEIMKTDGGRHMLASIMGLDENEKKEGLKYLIIGAGGTGGAVGSHLARAGHDVTFIARGRHLDAMRKNGLKVIKPSDEFTIEPVQAFTEEEYLARLRKSMGDDRPDVIFVCVKGYSVEDVIPFIAETAGSDTVVIPILNIFGTGGRMQARLPETTVTDGCIYVASEIREPGLIWMNGEILRVVFGLRKEQKSAGSDASVTEILEKVRDDLCAAGIDGILSDNIERDAMRKFSYVSPQGACGLYYNVASGAIQVPGEVRNCFAGLVQEISDLADAMGIGFGEDVVRINLDIMDDLSPDMTTSLQRDVAKGRASEIEGLIYEVPRLAAQYDVSLPGYERIAAELRARGIK